MTAQTYHLIANPFTLCLECGDQVYARIDGSRNLPCRCLAAARSICPTWDVQYGCQCSTVDEAEAFQEAVERAQAVHQRFEARTIAAVQNLPPRPAADLAVPVRRNPEVDKAFGHAARPPRPLRGLAWMALVVLVSLLFLLGYHLGIVG